MTTTVEGDEIPHDCHLDRSVEEFTAAPRKLFINGQWTDAASGRTFETPNPATGDTLARVAEGDAEDTGRSAPRARRSTDRGAGSLEAYTEVKAVTTLL